ncbi:MAG: Hpt domain-containing protein [Fluviicoccus sp.]|uniref:Hpt domain-containing protein n=1 Tax=Fluviicoccus sp. TaxID=2003552 RepID=UPI0027275743|nr:Hpt domain-containing protein [Fluviicoccus sp.]MDO8330357.1 Hpt domain-containing protein [Fluviicoccus sp.]
MSNNHNFLALDWVKSEIEETLKQAQQSLEAHVANESDSSQLRFCLAYLHQIFGTLQMVEFHGAAMLAEEMEKLCLALVNGKCRNNKAAYDALVKAMLQLPAYLERLQVSKRDTPFVLLPAINELRVAHDEAPLSEIALFQPDFSRVFAIAAQGGSTPTAENLKKLRHLYQLGLLGVLRQQNVREGLDTLHQALGLLGTLLGQKSLQALWQISEALIEGLINKSIPLTPAVKQLLGDIEHEIRKFAGYPQHNPSLELLKNILYYIAKSQGTSPTIAAIRALYRLDEALPSQEKVEAEKDKLNAPNRDALKSVIANIDAELVTVKDAIDDLMYAERPSVQTLEPLLPLLRQMSSTLMVMGWTHLQRIVDEQLVVMSGAIRNDEVAEGTLLHIAAGLLEVESGLQQMIDEGSSGENYTGSGTVADQLSTAQAAVLRESRTALEKSKEVIVEYISSQWDPLRLTELPQLLKTVRGGLTMLDLVRPSQILGKLTDFVEQHLLREAYRPSWSEMDTMADIVSSVEYYLERMANHHQNNDLLELAEKALDKLGYGLVFAAPAIQFPIQPYHDMLETRKEPEQDQSPASEMQEAGDTQQTLLNIPALVLPEVLEDLHPSNETAVNLPVALIDDDALIDNDDISGKTLVGMPALVLPEEPVQEEPSFSMDSTLTEIPALEIESLAEPSQEFAEKTLLSIPVITDDMLKGNVTDPDRTLINMPALNIPLMEDSPQADAVDKTLLSIPVVDIPLAETASEQSFSSFNDFDSTVSFDAEALLGDMTFTLRPSTTAVQSTSTVQVEEEVLIPEPDVAPEPIHPETIDAADVVVADGEVTTVLAEANEVQADDLMVDADETIGYQSEETSISMGSDTLESAPVARPVRPVFAAMPEDDFDQDDEIREIFIEEATEVMETIHEFFPKWASNFENKNALTEFRRGFHTLKGSGRMVGARVVGELAWSIENMLNRVIDKTATANGVMVNLISAVLEVVPELVENYNQRALPSIHTVPLMELANRFGKGESPTEKELAEAIAWSSQTESEIDSEPVNEPEDQISSIEVMSDASSTSMEAEEIQSFDSEFADDEVFELEEVISEADEAPGLVGQAETGELESANQQAAEPQTEQTQLLEIETVEGGSALKGSAVVSKINVLNHMPQDDFSQDDEIREIFIEEAEEVMETIHEFFPKWAANFNNKSALTEFRRGFHTLKGSGRMVGGKVVGELAWSIENMLNRVIDHTATPNEAMTRLITEVLGLIPELVTAFQNRESPSIDTGPMMTVADEFSRANPVTVDRVLDAVNQARHLADSSEVAQVDAVASETILDNDDAPEAVSASFDDNVSVQAQHSETVEQNHTDAFEALASSLEQVNPEDSDAGADPVLMEIFVCEANTYLDEIEQFLQGVSHGARMVVTDEVLRALHTLRGSSGMAGVKTVAGIAAPMETLFKDLRNQGRMLNAAHIELLGETHRLIKQSINSVAGGGQGLVSGDDLLLERIEQVSRTPAEAHEETYEVDQAANTAGIVAGFLDLGLDHLLDAPWELSGWLNGDDRDEHIATMLGELHQLHPEAVKAKIEPLSQLVAGLTGVYRQISRDPQSSLANEALMEALANAHDELINIFDTLAACQTVGANDELIQKLADWSAVAVEPAEQPVRPVAEIDNGADAELLSIFLEEGEEVLQAADDEFQSWKQDPDNKQALRALQRHLHTLKGGARMAVVASLGDLAHELEFIYEGLLDGRYLPSPILTDLLLRCHDRIAGQLSDLMATGRCEYAKDLVEVINQYRHTPKDTVILDFFSSAAGGSTEAPSIQPAAEPELQVAVAEDNSLSPAVATFVQPEVELEVPTSPAEGPSSGFDAEMLEIFLEEAQEIVEETNSKLAEWQSNPADTGPVKILQRGLHTLKGGARMSGVTALGDLAHEMENLYEGACLNRYQGTPAVFSILQRCHDRIAEAVDMLQASGQCPGVSDLVNALKRYLSNPAIFSDDRSEAASVKLSAAPVIPAVVQAAVEVATVAASAPMMDEVGIPSMLGNFRNLKAQQTAQEMIRVSSELMEKLINLAGEGSIIRSRVEMGVHGFAQTVEEMGATVQRLADQLRRMQGELESQIIAQHTTEGGKYEDFDPLEMDQYSSVNQLSKSLYESASDLMDIKGTLIEKARDTETLLLQQARLNTELQEGLMSSRMVPFSRLAPRLQRIVRQTSQEVHKPAELIVINAEGEMDRTLLERLVAPLEHMLRNSVDHGMEPPEDRARSGKEMMGRITLTLSREGGEVVLTLADDGRGINVEAVRNKAIERGLLSPDAEVSERELLQFIFHAGLSTAQKVTQVSGRGVGMDVVVSEIKQLGGAIAIASAQGKGTTFTLRLPFTVAVSRALMVRIGEDVYAIPLSQIEGIVRASPYELETYYAPEAPPFEYAGITYKLHYLGEFVHGLRTPSLFGQTLPLPILLVRGGEQRVAIQVDQLIGSREIVVKSVGAQLASVAGISGATILGDGSVVIILDVQAMLRAAAISKPRQKSDVEKARVVPEKATRTVMVVDDSVTVRKVTSRLLERHGYEVVLAKDGLDAITKLEDIRPDIMLLDIEMPRMDGFEVASLVRHNPNLVGLPIIMITSRTGEKHRERAFQIGVNCYMGKPFQEQQLLDTIGELLATAVER